MREWQGDLTNGYEEKKWRQGALQTSKERREGKWGEWEGKMKEEVWGKADEEEGKDVPEGENGDATGAENVE